MKLGEVIGLFVYPEKGNANIRIQDSLDFGDLYTGHCSSVPSDLLDFDLVNIAPSLEYSSYAVTFYVN